MQDRFGALVAIKNWPVPEVVFCPMTKDVKVDLFMNSSSISKILTVVDFAVTEEGKHRLNPYEQLSSVTAEERLKIKNKGNVK